MSDLDPEHVEAVGKVAAEALIFGDVVPDDVERHRIRDLLNAQAEAILTSTDPAVHGALLAALVRAGVLERKWRNLRPCGCRVGSNALMCCDGEAPPTIQARYASKWEETCD